MRGFSILDSRFGGHVASLGTIGGAAAPGLTGWKSRIWKSKLYQ
jgi:hypothetical protein